MNTLVSLSSMMWSTASMSNTEGHLAELLATEFQEWQLIVLTHDHIFFEHIRRRAPDWQIQEFTSWSYDEGPRTVGYQTGALLEKARERLQADDLQGAATKGRRLNVWKNSTAAGHAQAAVPRSGQRVNLVQVVAGADKVSFLLRKLRSEPAETLSHPFPKFASLTIDRRAYIIDRAKQ